MEKLLKNLIKTCGIVVGVLTIFNGQPLLGIFVLSLALT